MNKIIFGIFAHPDDEAFGPAGTLIKEVAEGSEVHLVTLTLGDAGLNPDGADDLADVRQQEWQESGRLIGASSMTYLGYKDGMLSNQSLVEIGDKLIDIIIDTIDPLEGDYELELMSIDLNGVTGHIDHIVAGRASAYAFYKLKQKYSQLTRLRLVCQPRHLAPDVNVEWIYMEAGRTEPEIDEVIDARQYNEQVIKVMRAHATQKTDGERHIKLRGDDIGLNYFLVIR